MRRLLPVLLAVPAALASAPQTVHSRGCVGGVPIMNQAISSKSSGGFDVSATSFAGKPSPGPAIRFWAYGHFKEANSGTQNQYNPDVMWLSNSALEDKVEGLSKNLFSLWQANWAGPDVAGCYQDLPGPWRTVLEMSFADPAKEGSPAHQGYYAVASVLLDAERTMFDFDQVRGGSGETGNIVPVLPIPAPVLAGPAKPAADGFVVVSLELPEPVSYSEGGKDKPYALVKGYRILYAQGEEPGSSDPEKYRPALDPANPKQELLGAAKPGKVQVAVPADAAWLVSQLVYDDPTAIYSRATSAHVGLQGAAKGGQPSTGGRGRKKERE